MASTLDVTPPAIACRVSSKADHKHGADLVIDLKLPTELSTTNNAVLGQEQSH
jgi:hypothetical protein